MSTEPDNLVLSMLRRLDAKLDRVLEDMADLKARMTSVEAQIGQIHIQFGHLHGDFAGQAARTSAWSGSSGDRT